MTWAAIGWSIALVAAAVVASRPSQGLFALMASGVYGLASFICHQRPERSFAMGDVNWPVCARCTGLYAGAMVGALVSLRPPSGMTWDRFVGLARTALFIVAIPTVLTLAAEWLTGSAPSNIVRAAVGFPLGVVLAAVLIVAAAWPARAVEIH